jgi:hypothetical protein
LPQPQQALPLPLPWQEPKDIGDQGVAGSSGVPLLLLRSPSPTGSSREDVVISEVPLSVAAVPDFEQRQLPQRPVLYLLLTLLTVVLLGGAAVLDYMASNNQVAFLRSSDA